jgi:hypothetical protein
MNQNVSTYVEAFVDLFDLSRDTLEVTFCDATAVFSEVDFDELQMCIQNARKEKSPAKARDAIWNVCRAVMHASTSDFGFPRGVRREVLYWGDVCIERTYEGHVRIDTFHGQTLLIADPSLGPIGIVKECVDQK